MNVTGKTYTCIAGETFDMVARKLFGKEKYAAEILSVNPENCRKSLFSGGEKLRIPDITLPTEGEEALPEAAPWREE